MLLLQGSNSYKSRRGPQEHRVTAAVERAMRVDLAAAFRLVVRMDLHEGVCNHFMLMLPDGKRFLLNPYGLHWSYPHLHLFTRPSAGYSGARYDTLKGAAFEPSPLVRRDYAVSAGVAVAWIFAESDKRVEVDIDE